MGTQAVRENRRKIFEKGSGVLDFVNTVFFKQKPKKGGEQHSDGCPLECDIDMEEESSDEENMKIGS